MAAPNIVNVSTITGKLAVANVTTAATSFVANPGSSGKVFKVNTLIVSNIDGTNPVGFNAEILRDSNTFSISKNIVINPSSSFTPFDKTLSLYLEEGDTLRISANANSDAQAVCAFEEIS